MLKNLKGKILAVAAAIMLACGGVAVAKAVNVEEPAMPDFGEQEFLWVSAEEADDEVSSTNAGEEIDNWAGVEKGPYTNNSGETHPLYAPNVEGKPFLSLRSFNISVADKTSLVVAVWNGGFNRASANTPIKMLFWTNANTDFSYGTEKFSEENGYSEKIVFDDKFYDCEKFYSKGFAPKELSLTIYFRAYVEIDGVEYYSEVKKYSVLDYVYEMREQYADKAEKTNYLEMLNAMLEFGGKAQTNFGYNTGRLANDTYYSVKVENGTLADGFDFGRFNAEETVKVKAPATSQDGLNFLYWEDGEGVRYGDESSCEMELTDFSKNITLTPVYASPWILNEKGQIAGYIGNSKHITVPSKINGSSVATIATHAFINNTVVESITIGEGISYILEAAFIDCPNLKTIVLSETVKSVSSVSFAFDCFALEEIIVHEENATFANYNGDGNLYKVDASKNVVELVQYATGKKDFVYYVPETVTSISRNAFRNARNVQNVCIHENVSVIESNAFRANSSKLIIHIENIPTNEEGLFAKPAGWSDSWMGTYAYELRNWDGQPIE